MICGTWYDIGIKGFHIGPYHQHYHCYTCLNPSTNGKRVTNKVENVAIYVMPKT